MRKMFKNIILAGIISVSALTALPVTASADWVKTEDGYSYTDAAGNTLKGWQTIKGKTYYFGKNGIRRTGLRSIGGNVYYFGKNGVMRTGVVKIKNKDFDFGADGKLIDRKKPAAVTAGGTKLETTAFYKDGVLMVPLRETAEALGYTFDYDEKSGTAVVDDHYIQKAALTVGSADVKFTGHLSIIDMSRDVTLSAQTVVRNDVVYAPSDIFVEFMNDVNVSGSSVDISPSTVELD